MNNGYEKKSFNPIGFVIGAGFGIVYGIIIDNLPIGIAIGTGIGVLLSFAFSNRQKKIDEKQMKIGCLSVILGLIVLLALFIIRFF